jgi:hypothetical protein
MQVTRDSSFHRLSGTFDSLLDPRARLLGDAHDVAAVIAHGDKHVVHDAFAIAERYITLPECGRPKLPAKRADGPRLLAYFVELHGDLLTCAR